jgi:hypothetical protein
MAAYYSLIIPCLAYYAFKIESIKEKVFMFSAAGVSYLALFLTHNRSGVLGILLALFIYMLLDKSVNYTRKIRMIVYASISFGFLLFISFMYFPEHINVYLVKLTGYLPGIGGDIKAEQRYLQADYSRVYFFLTVMESLLSNPIGNGFSKIYSDAYGVSSPHNIITYLIWAAGVMAFVWLPVFIYQIRKHFRLGLLRVGTNKANETGIILASAFQVGLLSWALNNMAHNSLSTGLAWMFLGLILNMIKRMKAANEMAVQDINASVEVPASKLGYIPKRV